MVPYGSWSMISPLTNSPVIEPQLDLHYFLITLLYYETAAPGNLRIFDCTFTLMISLKEQQCEMKDTLWKLRQVACLVIIRHVIFTSSPPVVGSCAWLIRVIHSQLAVL